MLPLLWVGIALEYPIYRAYMADTSEYTDMYTGKLERDYSSAYTQAWTYALYLTGMQTWSTKDAKAMQDMWYAATQWNLYFMFPLVLKFLRHFRVGVLPSATNEPVSGSRKLVLVCLIMTMVLWAYFAVTYVFIWAVANPLGHLPMFVGGILTAELAVFTFRDSMSLPTHRAYDLHQGKWTSLKYRVSRAVTIDTMATALVVSAICPLGMFGTFQPAVADSVAHVLIPVLFCALLYTLCDIPQRNSSLMIQVLNCQLINSVGGVSYPLYIVHKALGDYYINQAVHPEKHIDTPLAEFWLHGEGVVMKATVFCAAFVVAWCLQHYYQNKLVVPAFVRIQTWYASRK
ncbi:hypothetical protein SARC_02957 [Sphaeroforma arctica JP610]|uniref:Uncharacterized protein n=1 Tax=Sphaeroforma arctica JP610 TaxID=667725 RepID=A0A0L0G7I7_9EUKA|nr:hypothetical protein SARC_02957 [Sphaeroforma arctica JP610]KNC84846.1 hypothetical protein SARC_02957 [Sphaeroforma arctica JP610]|eukprot:XP_014158748.1 hypothetical protein SARC_02957 [Sphaeroforma arctica JP610]